ncbi:MAG TPA: hypothetical protein DEQ09_10150 [Bacteroidales bacterium]|nr:hypothetical protein [Bacteroidales bacterium]
MKVRILIYYQTVMNIIMNITYENTCFEYIYIVIVLVNIRLVKKENKVLNSMRLLISLYV